MQVHAITSSRFLIVAIKRTGPCTACGTRKTTGLQTEPDPLITTVWAWSSNQLYTCLGIHPARLQFGKNNVVGATGQSLAKVKVSDTHRSSFTHKFSHLFITNNNLVGRDWSTWVNAVTAPIHCAPAQALRNVLFTTTYVPPSLHPPLKYRHTFSSHMMNYQCYAHMNSHVTNNGTYASP